MALINLNLINKLESQADLGRSFAESCCYNHPDEEKLAPDVFMAHIKRAVQAEALLDQLVSIYRVSLDFAVDNFQPYIDKQESFKKGEQFDPFDELSYHFDSGMIDDLPKTIEQYAELLELLKGFSDYSKKMDEGFDKLFKGDFIPHYTVKDDNGDDLVVPRTELPDNILNEIDANKEIENISIEYCLDNYNEFYQQCNALIEVHRISGNIKECAESIQRLFTPYNHI